MARDGSGTYNKTFTAVSGTTIASPDFNTQIDDIATALTGSLAKDGQTTVTGNLNMGNNKLTNLAAGAAAADSATLAQVQASAVQWCGTAGGTANALTLTPSPAITAYAAGQEFDFIVGAASNTGATTVAVSGLSSVDLYWNGAAMTGGELLASRGAKIKHDGTRFNLIAGGTDIVWISSSGVVLGGAVPLLDGSSNELISFTAAGSAVNNVEVSSAATGNAPAISAIGDDTNIDLNLVPKGTGTVQVGGTGVIPERDIQQTTSSGTTFSFTGIPSWVTKIIIMFSGISFSSTDNLAVQIGDSGGTENTGYSSTSCAVTDASATNSASATNAFVVYVNGAGLSVTGQMTLTLLNDGNRWISSHTLSRGASSCVMGGGTKALSGTLDRLTITRLGAGNFDAGSVNIWYE